MRCTYSVSKCVSILYQSNTKYLWYILSTEYIEIISEPLKRHPVVVKVIPSLGSVMFWENEIQYLFC